VRSKVKFEIIHSHFGSWEGLFEQAAAFATSVGQERVISISHSADNGDGVVTVWYWATDDTDTNLLGLKQDE